MSDEKKKVFMAKILSSKKIPGIPANSESGEDESTLTPPAVKKKPDADIPKLIPAMDAVAKSAPQKQPQQQQDDNSSMSIVAKYKTILANNGISEDEAFLILKKIFLDDGYWSESYSMFGMNFSFRTRPSIYDRLIAEYMAAMESKNEIFIQYWKVVLSLASSLESLDGESLGGWGEEDFAKRVEVVEALPSMVRDLIYTKVLEFYGKVFTVIYTKGASDFFTEMTGTNM